MEKPDTIPRLAFGLCPRFVMRAFRLCRDSEEIEVVIQFTDSDIWITDLILDAEEHLGNDEFVRAWLLIVYDYKDSDLLFHLSSRALPEMQELSPVGIGGHDWTEIVDMLIRMQ